MSNNDKKSKLAATLLVGGGNLPTKNSRNPLARVDELKLPTYTGTRAQRTLTFEDHLCDFCKSKYRLGHHGLIINYAIYVIMMFDELFKGDNVNLHDLLLSAKEKDVEKFKATLMKCLE
ncbi:hypothetical protein HNP86_002017 [Methanococcus maripaludis]|uniref:Uncharacterized protein n=1 Tax=Methanococcus maripaludis TaxID=39152 RepID=A0A7J9NVY7_METMI|nr:hypothetical protein [Methanococcus maripaludis]MBA2851858.1 hypothetical protein [Methanococcus maripaludis]